MPGEERETVLEPLGVHLDIVCRAEMILGRMRSSVRELVLECVLVDFEIPPDERLALEGYLEDAVVPEVEDLGLRSWSVFLSRHMSSLGWVGISSLTLAEGY